MIHATVFASVVWHASLPLSAPPVDTVNVAQLPSAPTLDGRVADLEYGAATLQLTTAVGNVRIWVTRHDDHVYIAAIMPDSTFAWGDDLVISLDPLGRGDASPNVGDHQWYLRRVLDSSVVMVANAGGWYPPGQLPTTIGVTRHHADWDVASASSSSEWTVELRVRLTLVKPGPAVPRLAFRTYNNQPRGWWSWPAAPEGLRPQRVEQRPDLWVPIRLP